MNRSALNAAFETLKTQIENTTLPDEIRVGPYKIVGGRTSAYVAKVTSLHTFYLNTKSYDWDIGCLNGYFNSMLEAVKALLNKLATEQPPPAPTYVDHYEVLTKDPYRRFERYALRETEWQRKNKIRIIKIYRDMTGGGLAFCKNGADNNSFSFASLSVAQAFAKAVYMGGYIEYPDINVIPKNNDIPF